MKKNIFFMTLRPVRKKCRKYKVVLRGVQSRMIENLNELAREIIKGNQYCTLATADTDGNPWISPVAYVHDEKWNLYLSQCQLLDTARISVARAM